MAAQQFTHTTTGVKSLTNIAEDRIGTLCVQITGSFATLSVTFEGRVFPSALTSGSNITLGYTTPASSTVATTAITAAGIYWVRADGLMVDANIATLTGGNVVFTILPVYG